MFYRSGKKEDIEAILDLAQKELGQFLVAQKLAIDLDNYPSQIALDDKGLLGFALSEEIDSNILLVHTVAIRNEERCDKVGRCLLELLESKAANIGYHGILVSGFVQNSLLGCEDDQITFASYKNIYDSGGSHLLIKRLN